MESPKCSDGNTNHRIETICRQLAQERYSSPSFSAFSICDSFLAIWESPPTISISYNDTVLQMLIAASCCNSLIQNHFSILKASPNQLLSPEEAQSLCPSQNPPFSHLVNVNACTLYLIPIITQVVIGSLAEMLKCHIYNADKLYEICIFTQSWAAVHTCTFLFLFKFTYNRPPP